MAAVSQRCFVYCFLQASTFIQQKFYCELYTQEFDSQRGNKVPHKGAICLDQSSRKQEEEPEKSKPVHQWLDKFCLHPIWRYAEWHRRALLAPWRSTTPCPQALVLRFLPEPHERWKEDACSSEIRSPEKPKPVLCHSFQPAAGRSTLPLGVAHSPTPSQTHQRSPAAHPRFPASRRRWSRALGTLSRGRSSPHASWQTQPFSPTPAPLSGIVSPGHAPWTADPRAGGGMRRGVCLSRREPQRLPQTQCPAIFEDTWYTLS